MNYSRSLPFSITARPLKTSERQWRPWHLTLCIIERWPLLWTRRAQRSALVWWKGWVCCARLSNTHKEEQIISSPWCRFVTGCYFCWKNNSCGRELLSIFIIIVLCCLWFCCLQPTVQNKYLQGVGRLLMRWLADKMHCVKSDPRFMCLINQFNSLSGRLNCF